MIGAANSPMSMFTGGGNEAFQRGMMIGNVNSPFSSIGDAFKNTLDKYNAHLSAQQEQQNRLELAKASIKPSYAPTVEQQNIISSSANKPVTMLDETTGLPLLQNVDFDPGSGTMQYKWSTPSGSPQVPKTPAQLSIEQLTEAMQINAVKKLAKEKGIDLDKLNAIEQGASGAVAPGNVNNQPTNIDPALLLELKRRGLRN